MLENRELSTFAAMLSEQMQLLFEPVFLLTEAETAELQTAEREIRGMAEGMIREAGTVGRDFVSGMTESGNSFGGRPAAAGNRVLTQNIYLRENDPSPYQTARAIRRESEAMLRL